MDWKILFEDTILTVMDAIEEFMKSFNVAGSGRLREVWLTTVALFGLSLLLQAINKFSFIKWQAGLIAVIVMTIIIILDYININGTEKLKKKFRIKKGDVEDGE